MSYNDAMGSIDPNKVYKLAEAADLLRIDENTVYSLQDSGKLPKRIVGRGYKFLGSELLGFMQGTAEYSEYTVETESKATIDTTNIYETKE